MNQQKRINKILEAVEARIQTEVGALLGVDLSLVSKERRLVSKEDAFASLQGKQICAQMDITGEISGKSCLLMGIKDAIRLGGTLIMLPVSELEEVIGREEYTEEIEDSYGEIANIIAGSFTKDFEDMYSKSCRFVRKKQEILVPAKVVIDADDPIENHIYYLVSASLVLDDRQLGDMVVLIPAAVFGLQEQENIAEPGDQSMVASVDPAVVARPEVSTGQPDPGLQRAETGVNGATPASPKSTVGPNFDAAKHQKKVNRLLAECQKRMESEVGALLGVDIILSDLDNRLLSKQDFFFDQASGRQLLAELEVSGESQGLSYLAVSVKDAIRLGGILIMLPPTELENVVREEDFSDDVRDAYGEIANIISGVYTAVFEEQYTQKLRFIRKELRDVVPAKVDISTDEPFPDQSYYTSSLAMVVDGKPLGLMHMLFPAELLQLSGLRPSAVAAGADNGVSTSGQGLVGLDGGGAAVSHATKKEDFDSLDILVVGDDEKEAAKLAKVLENARYSVRRLSFKDNLYNYIPGNLKAIYLVMRDVNEQAFGVAIKVSSACSVPLIAAGPDWTRTKVIKAVKYGVRDIIVTPASERDLEENVHSNLLELAA